MTKVHVIGRSVLTPIGNCPAGVMEAVRKGESALSLHPGFPEPYFASLLERDGFEGSSFFTYIATKVAREAALEAKIDCSSLRTGLILSTIKADIQKLGNADVSPIVPAAEIARSLGITSKPIVVSNACISGLAAMIQGMRLIKAGTFDNVIVVGAELQDRFIVTGFQSLKALSPKACKPFDKDREGLNLGEAAAAVVLSNREGEWELVDGAIRNDANHISGPSRTGEGSYNALKALPLPEDLAFVNVHGTATLYNDEMEAVALGRAGLENLPVSALKGTLGHTMGAAGILESIISMEALDAGIILPTRGFKNCGVSVPLNISALERAAKGNSFVKLLSGFGGINGAMLLRKGGSK